MIQEQMGQVSWKSPSNIALVKYWGKRFEQLPMNPSLSFTLSDTATTTHVKYGPRPDNESIDTFLFDGKENEAFAQRVRKFTARARVFLPSLENVVFAIESSNSFPHSAGIASSASAMSALALCLCSVDAEIRGEEGNAEFITRASYLSRLGSGSAARSVTGPVCLWGKTRYYNGSSDEFALVPDGINPVFNTFQDSILLIDRTEKHVKSSAGHNLMIGHPYAKQRFLRANDHLGSLLSAMREGDIETFGRIVEAEALDLHAMMMTSTPSYMLLKPNSIAAIERTQRFRDQQQIPVFFTLDAGPNLHLLYPEEHKEAVHAWIDNEMRVLCQDGKVLHDHAGSGPTRLGE